MGSTAKSKQGIEEEERKTDEQAVNTGRLGKCTADQKRFGDGALALRLSCDGLDGLTCGITFADTGPIPAIMARPAPIAEAALIRVVLSIPFIMLPFLS